MIFGMKEPRILLVVAVMIWLPLAASAQPSAAKPAAATDPNPTSKKLCETVSMITGVAISPLLGTSAVGAYEYFGAKTPEAKARLPWFANPLFWVPAMLLVGACFLKDTAGIALPTVLKKPFAWRKRPILSGWLRNEAFAAGRDAPALRQPGWPTPPFSDTL